MSVLGAYQNSDVNAPEFSTATPYWLNKGDNAWQMTAATLVGIQSVPGLVILYGSYVKKKWAVNSTFMALYAFAMVLLCWILFAYNMSFGNQLLPFWGKGAFALSHKFLLKQSVIPEARIPAGNLMGVKYNGTNSTMMFFPMATTVYYQFVFAALTVILVAGAVLGRMNIYAWMLFVPLWLTFSYTVGAYSLWGGGFLYKLGVIDYCGGYVIHVSSGIAGFTAAYWVGPRLRKDRDCFPPNNLLLMLAGAGMLWLGWSGFNGGGSYAADIDASLAVLNTHICAATSLLVWLLLDCKYFFKRPSIIGAVQGMITGLVCITPAAGYVEAWAALIIGILAGAIPWYTINVLRKESALLKKVDDTMAVFDTHAVSGCIGGICVGLFAEPELVNLLSPFKGQRGMFYTWNHHHGILQGTKQVGLQIVGALFIIVWNVVTTSIICLLIKLVIPLRMLDPDLEVGDDAVHGEEAYALWNDGPRDGPIESSRGGSRHAVYGDTDSWKSVSDPVMPSNGLSTAPGSFELPENGVKPKSDA